MTGARRVLVVRADSLGDVLLAGPAVRAIATSGASVTMLCSPVGAAAARRLPGVDDVAVHRLPWIDADPEPVARDAMDRLVDDLAARDFDEAFVLTSFHQSALPTALLLRMAHVPVIAAVSEDYPGSLLDVRHPDPGDVHEVERALSLVGSRGYRLPPGDDGALRMRRRRTRTELDLGGDPYVVVHPGCSVPARTWAPDRFVALVDALVARGYDVAVTGSERERALIGRVAAGPRPHVRPFGGLPELDDLVDVVAGAAAIVVGNTGPAHVAAAVGTPVVSLFAPTVPAARWRPWRVPHVLLGDQTVACAGCRARVCPVAGHPCLSRVSVDDVVRALEELGVLPSRGTELPEVVLREAGLPEAALPELVP